MQSYVAGDGDGDGEVSFSIRDLMLRRLTVTGATRRHRRTESKGQILAIEIFQIHDITKA